MTLEQRSVIVLPGYMNSGDGHWQTRWEARYPNFSRVPMRDWDHPVCEEWCDTLDATIAASKTPVRFAAHSLGCLTVAFWAARHASKDALAKVAGALLVALPDPAGPGFPADAAGFDDVPMLTLPFPSIVVASTDDPYGGVPFSQGCAAAWGSRWENIGPRGHINSDSGLGEWDEGQRWLGSMA
ncbi:Alpha/beta hydrolase [Paraburkholderia sabiae]|uniref:RBBP9/YdeN family alpha/beta hydrolase n=1 Tax=Paraburkholderia sabiae TaxID=273251 RepID=UPI001CAE0495|nr:alpha/beta hydrolase [Paraburkholderia sabiae]CAG9230617.1 Alpha/beta hydrolase [Paraburkholderia sabiae]